VNHYSGKAGRKRKKKNRSNLIRRTLSVITDYPEKFQKIIETNSRVSYTTFTN
jgi:hypothetical protein